MKGMPSGPPPVGMPGKTCSFLGCERPHSAKSLCNTHYAQRRRGQALAPIKDRYPAKYRNEQGQKRCAECRVFRDEAEFPTRGRTPDRLHSRCRRCVRNRQLVNLYGIDVDTYDALLAKQGGCCGICGVHENGSGKVLAVDHDHNTGDVRGILCENCNLGLGALRDDPDLLRQAIDYIVQPPHTS